jgi:hypothetical protein
MTWEEAWEEVADKAKPAKNRQLPELYDDLGVASLSTCGRRILP